MKTILVNVGDSVELFNGTKGTIVDLSLISQKITISSPFGFSDQVFHKNKCSNYH